MWVRSLQCPRNRQSRPAVCTLSHVFIHGVPALARVQCHMCGMVFRYAPHSYGPLQKRHPPLKQHVNAFSRVAVGGGSVADIALQLLKQPVFWAALVAFCAIVTSYQIPVVVSPECLSIDP